MVYLIRLQLAGHFRPCSVFSSDAAPAVMYTTMEYLVRLLLAWHDNHAAFSIGAAYYEEKQSEPW